MEEGMVTEAGTLDEFKVFLEGHDHECPRCGSVCDCEVGSEFGAFDCEHGCE